jgi:hypothetical protein
MPPRLNDAFGFAWFTFRDATELKKASPEFAAEKDAFYKAYRAVREVSNMSKIWGDIKGYGEDDAKARGLFGFDARLSRIPKPKAARPNQAARVARSVRLICSLSRT